MSPSFLSSIRAWRALRFNEKYAVKLAKKSHTPKQNPFTVRRSTFLPLSLPTHYSSLQPHTQTPLETKSLVFLRLPNRTMVTSQMLLMTPLLLPLPRFPLLIPFGKQLPPINPCIYLLCLNIYLPNQTTSFLQMSI